MDSFILFTWRQCGNCTTLQQYLRANPPPGRVTTYELETIQNNQRLMNLFQQVSPRRTVPAIVHLRNGRAVRAVIGCEQIKNYLLSL